MGDSELGTGERQFRDSGLCLGWRIRGLYHLSFRASASRAMVDFEGMGTRKSSRRLSGAMFQGRDVYRRRSNWTSLRRKDESAKSPCRGLGSTIRPCLPAPLSPSGIHHLPLAKHRNSARSTCFGFRSQRDRATIQAKDAVRLKACRSLFGVMLIPDGTWVD